MAKKLRLGVIGTGGIFNGVHAPAWQGHPDVEIVAACDIVEEKAEKFAAKANVPKVFKDYRDLLKLDLDAVDICTPNLFHSEISVAALKSGKHVLCEKPDAVNPKEAQKMADAANASKKTLLVMRNNRFNPQSQFLKRFIDAGKFGEVYTGRCGWIRRRGIPGKGGWFTTKSLSGGGPLIDLGVHFIDLSIWLMGNPTPVAVTGATYCKFAQSSAASDSVHAQFGEAKSGGTFDVEDLATGFIRFDNGSSLQIEFSWASNIEQEMNFVELRGTKAGCSLYCQPENSWAQHLKLFTEQDGTLTDMHPKIGGGHKFGPHGAYIFHFVDVIQKRAQPIMKPEDGVNVIKILSAIYQSAQSGKEVRL